MQAATANPQFRGQEADARGAESLADGPDCSQLRQSDFDGCRRIASRAVWLYGNLCWGAPGRLPPTAAEMDVTGLVQALPGVDMVPMLIDGGQE